MKTHQFISEQACLCIATTCNLYCVYCHNPPTGKTTSLKQNIEEIKKRKVNAVGLEGGGEPTIAKDFFNRIVAYRKEGIKHFTLSTNAVSLADLTFCKKVLCDIDYLTINFPSHMENIYACATRSVKYPQAIKALQNIKSCGAEDRIRFFHIISSLNYKYLHLFADWVIRNYPNAALVNFTFVRNKGRALRVDAIVPEYKKVVPFLKLALAKLKLAKMKCAIQNMPLCMLNNFEGFSFEFHRGLRGDKVLETGLEAPFKNKVCDSCTLKDYCCRARKDYVKIYGIKDLKASKKDPLKIKPEYF